MYNFQNYYCSTNGPLFCHLTRRLFSLFFRTFRHPMSLIFHGHFHKFSSLHALMHSVVKKHCRLTSLISFPWFEYLLLTNLFHCHEARLRRWSQVWRKWAGVAKKATNCEWEEHCKKQNLFWGPVNWWSTRRGFRVYYSRDLYQNK